MKPTGFFSYLDPNSDTVWIKLEVHVKPQIKHSSAKKRAGSLSVREERRNQVRKSEETETEPG